MKRKKSKIEREILDLVNDYGDVLADTIRLNCQLDNCVGDRSAVKREQNRLFKRKDVLLAERLRIFRLISRKIGRLEKQI